MTIEIGGPSDGGGGGDGSGGFGGSGDNGGGGFGYTPAFLTKTFQIVNDPNTNSIISWGKFGSSFIIWDHIKFSAEILPNYFRHNNFSSFVYQLNNYGFRKIGVDHQWEYANQYFQEGKQHLLSNMRRRPLLRQNPTPRGRETSLCPQMLKKSIDETKHEIDRLKMQQLEMDSHIIALQREAKNFEATSKKLVLQWARACEVIIKRERENDHCDDEDAAAAKREKKKAVVSVEIPPEKNGDDGNEMVEENTVSLSEKRPLSSDDDHAQKLKAYLNDLNLWRIILLEDEELCGVEGEGSEIANQHAKKVVVSVEIPPEENGDDGNEMMEENTVSTSEKHSLPSDDDHVEKSKAYLNDLNLWRRILLEDEMCEVEVETEAEGSEIANQQHAKIAMDFQEWITQSTLSI